MKPVLNIKAFNIQPIKGMIGSLKVLRDDLFFLVFKVRLVWPMYMGLQSLQLSLYTTQFFIIWERDLADLKTSVTINYSRKSLGYRYLKNGKTMEILRSTLVDFLGSKSLILLSLILT